MFAVDVFSDVLWNAFSIFCRIRSQTAAKLAQRTQPISIVISIISIIISIISTSTYMGKSILSSSLSIVGFIRICTCTCNMNNRGMNKLIVIMAPP